MSGTTGYATPIPYPRCLLEWTEWVPTEQVHAEWAAFERLYGRPLSVRERLMCVPHEVLIEIGTRSGQADVLDVFLLKACHAAESVRRLERLL